MTFKHPPPGPELARDQSRQALLLTGRYELLKRLGKGSQGETWEALDHNGGARVAVKRFSVLGAESWKAIELAEREAVVLASLQHVAVPGYVDHFEDGGALYLVMKKVEGESLAGILARGGSLSRAQVWSFLREIADCLDYLHGRAPPVVHRDIKPSNIILRPDGSFCLVDFGSVSNRLRSPDDSTVVGTFGFMAPEQFQGRAVPVSDVYAVGATALTLLTGVRPEQLPHAGLAIDVHAALSGVDDPSLVAAIDWMVRHQPEARAPSVAAALGVSPLEMTLARQSDDAGFLPPLRSEPSSTKAVEGQRHAVPKPSNATGYVIAVGTLCFFGAWGRTWLPLIIGSVVVLLVVVVRAIWWNVATRRLRKRLAIVEHDWELPCQ